MTQATITPFTIPLALTAHHHAQTFRQYHGHPAKAKQVYLNTLAVYAVHAYLSFLDLDIDLEASPSWDPVQQMLLDTATLQVSPACSLECRPVLPGATHLDWPAETPDSSQGVIAVALDASLREAELLGFAIASTAGPLALTELQPIEALGMHLQAVTVEAPSVRAQPTALSQWWTTVTDEVWQAIDNAADLFATPDYAFGFRNAVDSGSPTEMPTSPLVSRMKRCQLGAAPHSLAVDLLVALQQVSPQEIDVYVQIKAAEPHLRLPENLRMAVLDDADTEVMQAQSLGTEALQMKFSTAPAEAFQLRLTLNEDSLTEAFVA